MIAYLNGTILTKDQNFFVLVANGVGYEVFVTASLWGRFNEGDSVQLYIHHHIREDAQSLYGFIEQQERDLFRKLISVSGIGPKSAQNALSAAPMQEIVQAIQIEDHSIFQAVSGIGPKTAKRLVLELKPKIELLAVTSSMASDGQGTSLRGDLISALEGLGYQTSEIREAISDMDLTEGELDESLRKALDKIRN